MRTDTEATEAPREASYESRSGRHRVRRKGTVLRFIGRLFLTAGVLLGGFIAWVLWGTGLFTAEAQGELREDLTEQIQEVRPGRLPDVPVPGQAYGVLQIGEMDLNAVVVQGTDLEDLKRGPGHYLETADPWDRRGRVGIAGHRTTYSAPFWDLDVLERGDLVSLVTARGTYWWKITRLRIVQPQDKYVLQAPATAGGGVRLGPRAGPRGGKGPSLVLTTCHPKFSAAQRLIAFGRMVDPPLEAPAETPDEPNPGALTPPSTSLFDDPQRLLLTVEITTGAALLVGIALAAVGARQRRRRATPTA